MHHDVVVSFLYIISDKLKRSKMLYFLPITLKSNVYMPLISLDIAKKQVFGSPLSHLRFLQLTFYMPWTLSTDVSIALL